MSDAPTPAEPMMPRGPTPEDTAYYRAVLHDLIRMGADIARHFHDRITDSTAPEAHPEPSAQGTARQTLGAKPEALALAFERVARTLRRTVLLAQRLDDLPVQTAAAAGRDPVLHRIQARTHLIRHVENRIHAKAKSDEAHALRREFHERLDSPDLDDDILSRPVQDIIDDILKDLGLHPYSDMRFWPRRPPAEIQAIRHLAEKTPARSRPVHPATLPDPFPKQRNRCEGEAKAIAKILLWDHERRTLPKK